MLFKDNRSYYGYILALTDERITNIENLGNDAEGGKEGFSPKAALSTRNPPMLPRLQILQNVKRKYWLFAKKLFISSNIRP